MFGTLIGIFLTSTGIFIAADTVLWGSTAPNPTRGEKTCTPGERSVAVFEGWYGDGLYLFKHFHDMCQTMARSQKSLSLEAQADMLIQKLRQTYRDHTGPLPSHTASLPPPSSKHIASIAVAGFDGPTPIVTVRELRWDKNRKGQWQLLAERVGKQSFQGCGAKFIGEVGIAALLLDTSAHFEQEKHRPDVRAANRANTLSKEDDCISSSFSMEDAKGLYMIAIRMTIDHGKEFQIENGAVGGRLHMVTIPKTGPMAEESIDPEQYLK